MTKYREILRLQSLGFSERNIAQSCGVSRNTVAKVLKKAISWPLDFDMTDSALEELMFPKDKSATNKRMADAFRIQMDDPTMKEVPFEDRFGMLVDVEYSNRKNKRLKRLIRQAEFEQPDASIAAIHIGLAAPPHRNIHKFIRYRFCYFATLTIIKVSAILCL